MPNSIRNRIKDFLKNNKIAYDLYYYTFSFLLSIVGRLIPMKRNRVLFVCYGGKQYDDSPRVIFEAMIKDKEFNNCQFIWAFEDPSKFEIERGTKLKIDSIKYFFYAMSSKVWISNSAVERGLKFKNPNTFFLNTWHGTPIKKIGRDSHSANKTSGFGSKDVNSQNIMLAQSQYESEIFTKLFDIKEGGIVVCGLPRNDELHLADDEAKKETRKKLGIPADKTVILYAPTYREYERDQYDSCVFTSPIDFLKWERQLGETHYVIYRTHYEVKLDSCFNSNSFIVDYSSYPKINDLMIASDILISDYSSIFVDYSILGKPMIAFPYDYKTYEEKRGLYKDIYDLFAFPICTSVEELFNVIVNIDEKEVINTVEAFHNNYYDSEGNATSTVLGILHNILNEAR